MPGHKMKKKPMKHGGKAMKPKKKMMGHGGMMYGKKNKKKK